MHAPKAHIIIFVLLSTLLVAACSPAVESRPTAIISYDNYNPLIITATPMPTFTPTPAPLGSADNPMVMGLIASNPPQAQVTALQELTAQLSTFLQMSVTGRIFTDYLSLETALQKQQVHLAWLGPVEYLLASEKGLLSSQLVSNHLGVNAYGVQFLAHKDSNLISYYDVGSGEATVNAATALAQFSGMRPCLTQTKSLAGYWIPLAYLAQNNIPIQAPVLAYSYSAAMRAVYIKGVCDFTATYAIASDPRTSSEVIGDLQDALDRLPIIWISPAVIPNLAFSASPQLPLPLTVQISEYMLQLGRNDTGRALLSEVNQYEIAGLEAMPDDAYSSLRELLAATDARLIDLLP
jgi:phosphonate transport system substrate-binding protein